MLIDRGTSFIISIPTGCAHLPKVNSSPTTSTPAPTIPASATYLAEVLPWQPEEETRNWGLEAREYTSSPQPLASSSSSARILLVDDNADMREYVQRLLNLRYKVEAVGDGVAALAAIAIAKAVRTSGNDQT